VNLASNSVQYISDDGSSDVFGPAGSLVPNVAIGTGATRVITIANSQATDSYVIEFAGVGTNNWLPVENIYPYIRQSTKSFGVRGYWTNSTTFYVEFGDGGTVPNNATYAGNSTGSWADDFAAGARFRLVRAQSGQAVGFGEVAQNSSGLVKSAGQLLGTNTNDNAATGYVGEVLTNTSSTISLTNNTYADAGTITLTAGDWDVSAMAEFSGTPTGTQLLVGLGTATGNSSTGISFTHRALIPTMPNGSSQVSLHLIPRRYTVANGATQVLYVKVRGLFSASTLSADGHIQARRVR
jgi:hypothetical protein